MVRPIARFACAACVLVGVEIDAGEAQAYVRGRVRERGVLWPGDLGREAWAVACEFSLCACGLMYVMLSTS